MLGLGEIPQSRPVWRSRIAGAGSRLPRAGRARATGASQVLPGRVVFFGVVVVGETRCPPSSRTKLKLIQLLQSLVHMQIVKT